MSFNAPVDPFTFMGNYKFNLISIFHHPNNEEWPGIIINSAMIMATNQLSTSS